MKKLTVLFLAVFLFSSCNVFRANDILDADFKPSKKGQVNVFFSNSGNDYALQNVCKSSLIPAYFYRYEVENDNCTELRLPYVTNLQYSRDDENGFIKCFSNEKFTNMKDFIVQEKTWKNCSTVLLTKIINEVFITDSIRPVYMEDHKFYSTSGINIIIKFN